MSGEDLRQMGSALIKIGLALTVLIPVAALILCCCGALLNTE